VLDAAVAIHDAGEHLRPAQIDADDTLSVQGPWLPYSVDGEG